MNARLGEGLRRLSLRQRLFVGIDGALALSWAAWFGCQAVQMSREQTGIWDRSLQAIAAQLLLSVPGALHASEVAPAPGYRLPAEFADAARDGEAGLATGLAYQVWAGDGRLLMRSANAPGAPLAAAGPAARGGVATTLVDGQAWRGYALWDRERRIQVQVGKLQATLDAELRRWMALSITIALGLAAAVGLVVWAVVWLSLRPVQRLVGTLGGRDPLDLRPLPEAGMPAELEPLVRAFNRQLLRLDGALASERRFIADAAHELRTPLAVLRSQAELAHRCVAPDSEAGTAIAALIDGVQRSARLVAQLLDIARMDVADALPRTPLGLHEVAALVVHDFEADARLRGLRLVLRTEPCEVQASLDALGIALRNLIDNAVQHAAPGGRVHVDVSVQEGCPTLEVAGDGPGVAEAERAHVFDRFRRGPDRRYRGSGLGLSLVARIAQLHGASVDCGAGLNGRGFAVRMRFSGPAQAEAASMPVSGAPPSFRPA